MLLALSLATPLSSHAAGQGAAAEPALTAAGQWLSATQAQAWVERVRQAPQAHAFRGVVLHRTGTQAASLQVALGGVGDQTLERVEALDGDLQQVFRRNGRLLSLWPTQKLAVVEPADDGRLAAGFPVPDPRALAHYETLDLGEDRLAGRPARVLGLRPRDGLRWGQRWWVDLATGLLLRVDLLGAQGTVLETLSFSTVEIAAARQGADLQSLRAPRLGGYRVRDASGQETQLAEAGWVLHADRLPPGFRWVSTRARQLIGPVPAPAAGASPAAEGQEPRVFHAVYSDGLAQVSVFLEPLSADGAPPDQQRMQFTQAGGTVTWMRQSQVDRWKVVVMGDVPPAAVKAFAAALERRP